MTPEHVVLLAAAVLVIAFLYSSVGHAGASGYIAVMSLFSLTPAFIRPTALTLNILVSCLAAWQFWRAGYFSWSLFWPFALLSVPFAFIGGYISLPTYSGADFRKWCGEAGFKRFEVIHLAGPSSAAVAYK